MNHTEEIAAALFGEPSLEELDAGGIPDYSFWRLYRENPRAETKKVTRREFLSGLVKKRRCDGS